MPDERQQFRILYRDFLSRMVDVELIAVGGDARSLVARFGAILISLSFIIAYLMVPRYGMSGHAQARLARLAWDDEEFLISATITLAGLCMVLAWNTVFPDRRDSLILGLIPVRMRAMLIARVAAIGTVLGGVIAALNSFTGLSFPFALATGPLNALASFLTWWLVHAAAAIFTFCAGLALQGIAGQVLPWRLFLRLSGFLQMAALFAVLAAFFMTSPFGSEIPPVYFPSFWFVGLLHVMRGDSSPVFAVLMQRAVIGIGVAIPLAAALYVLSWKRNVRRIVESPDILPAKRSPVLNRLAKLISSEPFGRAILLFTLRGIARSRQHRMMLAIYGGFAFALSLAFAGSMVGASHQAWSQPNIGLLIAGFLLLCCGVVGTRTIFALPITLPANWIFRITAVHRPGAYFAAVRKALYLSSATPIWIITSVCYLALWPGRPAFEHILVLGLTGIILVERSLYQFRKVPFACSWLPGHAHGKMKAGIWGFVFLVLGSGAAGIELWSMEKTARIAVVLGILGALAIRARFRTREFAADPDNRLQFEDTPPADIFALDLRQDGSWSGDEAYVDTIDPNFGRGLAARARPFAVATLLFVCAGFIYERIGDWRDRKNFPEIGRSFDIGGRSLNMYCTGEGSPTVVFDSGGNQPGYAWKFVQPAVAGRTRACWYDRAGYGWSDSAPGSRTSADIAGDLHKLLHAAGIPAPFILVGHSFGGFNVRMYANRYRGEVAGLVLVDSEDEYEDPETLPEALQSPAQQYIPRTLWRSAAVVAKFLVRVGLERLIDGGTAPLRPPMTARDRAVLHALQLQAKTFAMMTEEGLDRDESAAQVRAVRNLGDVPLVVLTAGRVPPLNPENPSSVAMAAYMQRRILGTQAQLAALSSRGRQIRVEYSGHAVPFDAPGAIVAAVGVVVDEVRGNVAR